MSKSEENMVKLVHRPGVIEKAEVGGKTVFAEKGRDPRITETS